VQIQKSVTRSNIAARKIYPISDPESTHLRRQFRGRAARGDPIRRRQESS